MKSTNNFVRIASTVLCLLVFASASFAATKPLIYPRGLAVDAKGNLYVANSGGNDILVYNLSYIQVPSKTITQNVISPTGVAFDPQGNLWVANYGTSNGGVNGSIGEYIDGKQNTSASITTGILAPGAITIDGLGNVWVQNDNVNVTVYASTYEYASPTTIVRTLAPTFPIYGIAVGDSVFSYGSNTAVSQYAATPALISGALSGGSYGNDTGFVLATDAAGDVYMGNLDGSVNVATPHYAESTFVQLSFVPYGIAVDSTRGRVYMSNYNGNSISVYSTAGVLLKTIE